MELADGLAPTTACLQNRCSAIELRQQCHYCGPGLLFLEPAVGAAPTLPAYRAGVQSCYTTPALFWSAREVMLLRFLYVREASYYWTTRRGRGRRTRTGHLLPPRQAGRSLPLTPGNYGRAGRDRTGDFHVPNMAGYHSPTARIIP
jgi:hypothetical protein